MKYGGLQSNCFNDPKIMRLEAKYGSVGIHCWFRLLTSVYDKIRPENLTCKVEMDAELLAASVKIEESLAGEIMAYLGKIELLIQWCQQYYLPTALNYADKTLRNQVANLEEISQEAKANLRASKKTSFYIDIKPNTQWPKGVPLRVVYGLDLPSQSLNRSKISRSKRSKDKLKEVEVSSVDVAPGHQPALSESERQRKIALLNKNLCTAQTYEEQERLQKQLAELRRQTAN